MTSLIHDVIRGSASQTWHNLSPAIHGPGISPSIKTLFVSPVLYERILALISGNRTDRILSKLRETKTVMSLTARSAGQFFIRIPPGLIS